MNLKKYFLSRLSPHQKFTLSRYPFAEHTGAETIGPFLNYNQAVEEQKKLNEEVEKNNKK